LAAGHAAGGTLVLLKDFKFPSRPVNHMFTAILALLLAGIIFNVAPLLWYGAMPISSDMGQ
jgi:hypothetical protein